MPPLLLHLPRQVLHERLRRARANDYRHYDADSESNGSDDRLLDWTHPQVCRLFAAVRHLQILSHDPVSLAHMHH